MELYLYMFKHNILEARPTEKWLRRCRWYAIKEDKSERFKAFLSYLESVFYPRIDLTFKGERYFVIVKAGGIREHYVLICPDIVYDVIIFLVGVNTKASSKISEVKEKFNQIYEKVKNEIK
jgi:hypothetical protein